MYSEVLACIEQGKIMAIIRGAQSEECIHVARALYAGGIKVMEVTYDQLSPNSWKVTAETIQKILTEFDGRMFVGAGTVTTPQLVELTHSIGGQFIVSPNTDIDVIRRTKELGMLSFPGAMTPSEILSAHDAGADMVKLFPAADLGTAYFKAIRAPINHVKIMAVGGINKENIQSFLSAGACAVGVGGNLANKKWIASGEFSKITQAAQEIISKLS